MTKWEGGNWGSCERNAMSKWNKAVVDIGFADERVKLHAIFALGGLILFQNSYHEGHFGLTQMVDLALLGCAGLGSNTGIFMIHASLVPEMRAILRRTSTPGTSSCPESKSMK